MVLSKEGKTWLLVFREVNTCGIHLLEKFLLFLPSCLHRISIYFVSYGFPCKNPHQAVLRQKCQLELAFNHFSDNFISDLFPPLRYPTLPTQAGTAVTLKDNMLILVRSRFLPSSIDSTVSKWDPLRSLNLTPTMVTFDTVMSMYT